jgi:exonuclease, DNA polymerase III, epsilon subunit family
VQRCKDYVAIDLETSGLSVARRKIIEIAAIKVKNNEVTDSFTTLVNPGIYLEDKIVELTGITDDMLCDCRNIKEILPEFLSFIDGNVLLGHNILFDYSFIKKEAVNADLEFEAFGIDTLRICKKLMPAELSKSLSSACDYFKIEVLKSHRAYEDAYNTHLLYQSLLKYPEAYDIFTPCLLKYKYKKERKATLKEKEYLIKLLNYHKIKPSFNVDELTVNELSRIRDSVILKYGLMKS